MGEMDEYGPAIGKLEKNPESKHLLNLLKESGLSAEDELYIEKNPAAARAIVRLIQEAHSPPDRKMTRRRLDGVDPKSIYDAGIVAGMRASPADVAAIMHGGIPDASLASRLHNQSLHAITVAQQQAYKLGIKGLPWDESLRQQWLAAPKRQDERGNTSTVEPEAGLDSPEVKKEISERLDKLDERIETMRGLLGTLGSQPWAQRISDEVHSLGLEIADCSDSITEIRESYEKRRSAIEIQGPIRTLEENIGKIEQEHKRLIAPKV